LRQRSSGGGFQECAAAPAPPALSAWEVEGGMEATAWQGRWEEVAGERPQRACAARGRTRGEGRWSGVKYVTACAATVAVKKTTSACGMVART